MPNFRAHISFILALSLLVGTVWQTITVAHFYLNREAITEKFCENIDRPELNCKGKCHLKKQLEASTPDQEETRHTGTTKTALFLFVFANTLSSNTDVYQSTQQEYYTLELNEARGFYSTLLNPPEIS